MSLITSAQWMYSSGASFYDYEIENSLRFEDGSSANLTRTPSSTGDRQTWTFSAWLKRGNLTGKTILQSRLKVSGTGNNITSIGMGSDDTFEVIDFLSGNFNWGFRTLGKFRDVSSWYHLVVECDSTQATASDRVKLYINGVQQAVETKPGWSVSYPNQNENTNINHTYKHYIGIGGSADMWDGYMADVNLIDGTALDPTSFGETKSGVWIPKDTSGLTFDTNGFRLEFGDSAAIGDDTSGNGNDWTANNLSAHDVVPDSPTNNYAVVNPLARSAQDFRVNLSEGNLNISAVTNSDSNFNTRFATIPLPSSGKYYVECRTYVISNNGNQTCFGVVDPDAFDANEPSSKTLYNFADGEGFDGINILLNPNTAQAYSGGATSGSQITGLTATSYILKLALDIDNGKVFVGYDGVWLNSADPAAGTGEIATRTFTTSDVIAITTTSNQFGNNTGSWLNFGQDSTFGGNVTAGGNSDANGYGDFAYAVPSGYLALNSANLPEPPISPLNDDIPEDYFNTRLYSGNSSTQSVTGVGFQPDWLWLKSRTHTNSHLLVDSVRGSGSNGLLYLIPSGSSGTNKEVDDVNVTSLDSDGFTLASNAGTNGSGRNFVSWNWKANGSGVSNTDGSITATVSANPTSGFSIVTYTGTGTSTGDSFGHALGVQPKMVIIKNRTTNGTGWNVLFPDFMTSGQYMALNLQNGITNSANSGWGGSLPDSTQVYVGGSSWTNTSGNNYVAYCFANVEGYSKIGSYTGSSSNSSTDNTFVYTGFRPAWVMVKQTNGTGHWHMYDNKRGSSNEADPTVTNNNVVNKILYASLNNLEVTYTTMDFVSNGFKFRTNQADISGSGQSYTFMAFAEMPQKYANAR